MSSTDKIDKVAKRILDAADHGERVKDFDDEEADALRDIAQIWIGMKVLGRAAVGVQKVIKYLAWLALVIVALRGGLTDFIKGAIGK
ncbi:MAG: hypothetical protein ACRCTD_15705 [Beijerinckiaceae bacterium]